MEIEEVICIKELLGYVSRAFPNTKSLLVCVDGPSRLNDGVLILINGRRGWLNDRVGSGDTVTLMFIAEGG